MAAADMWKLRTVKSTKVSRLNVLAFKSILRSLISTGSESLECRLIYSATCIRLVTRSVSLGGRLGGGQAW
jgi:hypothetical protein